MTSTNKVNSGSKKWIFAGVGFLTAIILFAAWYLTAGFDTKSNSSVKDMLSGSTDLRPIESTEELCSDDLCEEAWTTTNGDFLRFGNPGQAEQYVTYLGDNGRRWKNIVLDMTGKELKFDEKKYVIDILFSKKDWS